ncbi:MAG: hypothetical protein R6U50_02680 [Desulfobacterales bacterium]
MCFRRCILALCILLVYPGFVAAGGDGSCILGRDPISKPYVVENHSQALVYWVEKEYSDCTLIHIDAHDDLRRIPEDRISRLQTIFKERDLKALKASDSAGDKGFYHPGNFLYAAFRLGIIKKVYWIIPFPCFSVADPVPALRSLLRHASFPEEDIATFELKGRTFTGNVHGASLILCPSEELPGITGPVLLSIDADFFPPLAAATDKSLFSAWHSFSLDLFAGNYLVRDVIIARSIDGGFLEPVRRWVAEQSREILSFPNLLHEPLPRLWKLREHADFLYVNGGADLLLQRCRSGLSEFPRESTLLLYKAFAHLARGETDQAFGLSLDLCRRDPGLCPGMADLGQLLLDADKIDAALRFFEKAYERNPAMNYRQTELAHAMRKKGRYREALLYYEICRKKNGCFPTDFLMGQTCLLMGRRKQALFHFDRGLSALERDLYPVIRDEQDFEAIQSAVIFYEQNGMKDKATSLAEHPFISGVRAEHS